MKALRISVSILAILCIMACESNAPSSNLEMSDALPLPEMPALPTDGYLAKISQPNDREFDKKLVKKGRIEFEADQMDSTKQQILTAVTKYRGYISSDQEYKSTYRITNTFVIRVPADQFDAFLVEATKGVKKFDHKSIDVKDVTEEFLDIQARLKTKKELEARYRELLKKATNVKEMLSVEEQIGLLRSDIESFEGRLKYLQDRVSFSEISISMYQELATETGYAAKFKNGFKNGWDNLVLFFIVLVNLWPFLLMLLFVMVGFRYWRKKKRVKRKEQTQ